MTTTHTIGVPGGILYYELRGTGPVLVVTGSPMDAPAFAPLADALRDTYTVVTHDPRGVSRSTLDDIEQDSTPELRADDLVAILDDLGARSADVFGSSGGAVTGLALVARHPARVRTLVAHEPPLLELLPDAAEQRAGVDDLVETFHREGPGAAWAKFMARAGFDTGDGDGGDPGDAQEPDRGEPSARDLAGAARFFGHELRGTTRYVPDTAALTAGPARVVAGIGAASGDLLTSRTTTALAGLLGTPAVEFPGDHGGFMVQPAEFAEVLRRTL
ncbi:alpha/beta hydrolase [Streptomyces sp. NPDC005786]|uniref:alpha/beta fold hydrolase n=1 Tax=unclassified Streptomyces TaxID=2593676 RepID=UPI0033CB74DF